MTTDPPESFGDLPHDAETFGSVPQPTEPFRSLPHGKEKTEHHTLSVREVARHFEHGGVARTERSIVNWCTLNKQEISRLDCYYDPNERRYFITPQSVERAIEEEHAKAKATDTLPNSAEAFGTPSHLSADREARYERGGDSSTEKETDEQLKALKDELFNLKVDKAAKDQFVTLLKDQITADRAQFKEFVTQIAESAHTIGELETKLLLQLEGPRHKTSTIDAETLPTSDLRSTAAVPASESEAHAPVTVHVVEPDAPEQTSSSLP